MSISKEPALSRRLPYIDDMLALIALLCIRTCTCRFLGNLHLVNIAGSSGKIKDLLLMSAIFMDSPISINEEHTLRHDTVETVKK